MRHLRAAGQAGAGFLVGIAFVHIPGVAGAFAALVGLFGLYLWIESRSER